MRSLPFHARYLSLINGISVACFLAGAIFAWRAVSSISTGMMILSGLAATNARERKNTWPAELSILGVASLFFFLAECSAAFLHPPPDQHLDALRTRAALIFIPLACYCSFPLIQAAKLQFTRIYSILLCSALVYCFLFHLTHEANLTSYLYHELVSPIGQHAVLFSGYLFFALLLLLEDLLQQRNLFPPVVSTGIILFLLSCLILLSSKLIILLCLIWLTGKLFHTSANRNAKNKIALASVILAALLIILSPNAIHQRFRELVSGDAGILKKESFSPGQYFNAWEFRLLQFRLVPEILTAEQAWAGGTGAGNAQNLLNAKYEQLHMYAGEPGSDKKGYQGYDTHDQWLQSLLEAGIPGLMAFAAMIISLWITWWRQRRGPFLFLAVTLTAFSFTDAALASQYGIVLFLFFPFFFWTKPGTAA